MLMDKAALCALIPHHGNMCLLDGVESWSEDRIVCISSSHAKINNPLRKNGRLHALIGIEYAAQAMAVHGALLTLDGAPRPGYLAGLREIQFFAQTLDYPQAVLRIEAERLMGDSQHLLYQFQLYADTVRIISGRTAVILDAL